MENVVIKYSGEKRGEFFPGRASPWGRCLSHLHRLSGNTDMSRAISDDLWYHKNPQQIFLGQNGSTQQQGVCAQFALVEVQAINNLKVLLVSLSQ